MAFPFLALSIGVLAGSRTMAAPAAVSWAALSGRLALHDTPLAFLGHRISPYVFTLLAVAEAVVDPLPGTPSRTVPVQFGARLASGGFCGAAVGLARGAPVAGSVAGLLGACLGTLGSARARAALAGLLGTDLPAALVEDVAAGGAALAIATRA